MNLRALGYARVAVGTIFLIRTTPLFSLFPGLIATHGGPLYGWPQGRLRAAVLGLLLPPIVVKLLVFVRTLAALAFTLGVRAREAGIVASLSAYLVYAQEPFSLIFTLHVLYLSTFLLACTDAVSVVALKPVPPRSPNSSIWLLRAFVVSIYVWSAIAKLRRPWLDGSILARLYQEGYATGPVADLLLATHPRFAAMATVGFELGIPLLLVLPKTRAVGIFTACAFHAALETAVHPDVFGWVVVALLASFWPHLPTMKPQ